MPIIIAIVVILLVVALFVISIYNKLVSLRNLKDNAWSQIDVALQRRFDLIPNLVETVKGYMNHEDSVLTKIAELRTSWANANTVSDKANLDGELSTTLKSLFAVAENYPELKANTNFIQLQEELGSTEDKVATTRSQYNNYATSYNTALDVFPSNIIGGMFSFKRADLFEVANDEVREAPKVKF